MQERRKTTRTNQRFRMQHSSSSDLLPDHGWIKNLSEQGVGLFLRKNYREGDRMHVTFSLPGQQEPLTLTGAVRWSGQTTRANRWRHVGLEWLPPEETPRNRLQQWLTNPPRSPWRATFALPAWLPITGFSIILLIGAIGGLRISSLRWQQRQLEATVQQRDVVIRTLASRDQVLESALGTAKEQLAHTSAQVLRLDQQTHALEGAVQQLTQEMSNSQQAYVAVQQEREALMQHVLDLEQERRALEQRLTSLPALRVAMKEAIEARQQTRRTEQQRLLAARRAAERQQLALGNRGFLFREGHPTVNSSTVWIRIHEPESGELQGTAPGENVAPATVADQVPPPSP